MIVDVERALRDPEYRKTLTAEQRKGLPPIPDELDDDDLSQASGGAQVDFHKQVAPLKIK